MANIDLFASWLHAVMHDIQALETEAANRHSKICNSTAGWASPSKMHILDIALRLMAPGEEYLEIGSYTGRSITGALHLNDKRAQVIDPFGLFLPDGDFIQGEWEKTVKAFGVRDRITLHKTLCHNFQAALPPIGVFYYDGDHDSGHTYEGLKRFEQYLSPQAIIIVDDYMIYGGHAQRAYPDHETIIANPVQIDVDRWLIETADRTKLISVLPWENQSAVILYERNR